LTITHGIGASRLRAVYTENLPTGMMRLSGPLHRGERVITAYLGDPSTSAQLFFWLLAPAPPTAVIGGLMSGTTLMSAEPQLSLTRLILFRIPTPMPAATDQTYLQGAEGIAADLARSGLVVDAPPMLDAAVAAFLMKGDGAIDQITSADYRDLVDLLDRHWLAFRSEREPCRSEHGLLSPTS
jgi:hypothetical protein